MLMEENNELSAIWAEFWAYLQAEKWHLLERKQRQELHEANAAANGRRKYALGPERLRRLMQTYAPQKYLIHAATIQRAF